jgi:predicted glutamine amidotransferase
MFAALSCDPLVPSYFLTDAPYSLLRQSRIDPRRRQADGWGIGWFAYGDPQIEKSPKPVYSEISHLKRAAQKASGNALIGHVRWASNPLKLPKHELLGCAHTQPFTHGGWIFAHNGTLLIPREIETALGPWKKYVKGKNDSEILFYWLMKTAVPHLRRDPVKAIQAGMHGIDLIWQKCRKSYPIHKFPYHGLNWVLTNGRELYAFCFCTPEGFDKNGALIDKKKPYYQLHMKSGRGHVIIASEPLDRDGEWEPFSHGQLITAKLGAHIDVAKYRVRFSVDKN